jgi:putative spermidine/putrescine transport system permease protein
MRFRSRLLKAVLVTYCCGVFAFLMLPLVIVFPLSVSSASYLQFPPPGYSWRWFRSYLESASWVQATALSIQVGCMTALLAVLLGVPLAFYLTRTRMRLIGSVVDKLSVSPLIIPSIVTAVVVYRLFASYQMIGTTAGLVLGHSILALPFVIVAVSAGLRTFDPALEDAAMGLGANRFRAVIHVTLPQLRPSIFSGAFFAFMASFDDLILALYLSGSNMTLPRKTFENILFAIDPTIAAVSVLQILFVLALGGAWYFFARGWRRSPVAPNLGSRNPDGSTKVFGLR